MKDEIGRSSSFSLILPIHPFRVAGMTRLELANQLIEGQSAFHFAFIPKDFGARGEIRTHQQAEFKSAASAIWATRACRLRNAKFGLRIGFLNFQSAIRIQLSAILWYPRRDSNPHCTDFESVVSCQVGLRGRLGQTFLSIHVWNVYDVKDRQECLSYRLVPAEGFEPTLSSF